jgi:hypothetical protein
MLALTSPTSGGRSAGMVRWRTQATEFSLFYVINFLFMILTCGKYCAVKCVCLQVLITKQTPWPESASELYRPSDRRMSAKLVSTFTDRGVPRSQRGGSPAAVISVF